MSHEGGESGKELTITSDECCWKGEMGRRFTGKHSKPSEGLYRVPKREMSFDQKKEGEHRNSERAQVPQGEVSQGKKSGVCSKGRKENSELLT